mmetsp:Transcript_64959/g.186672  ORF Transcript_64959/g.186672 Transcript_64959/m.186672 type:complete len:264 (-) Transcript_64959:73-864(-)
MPSHKLSNSSISSRRSSSRMRAKVSGLEAAATAPPPCPPAPAPSPPPGRAVSPSSSRRSNSRSRAKRSAPPAPPRSSERLAGAALGRRVAAGAAPAGASGSPCSSQGSRMSRKPSASLRMLAASPGLSDREADVRGKVSPFSSQGSRIAMQPSSSLRIVAPRSETTASSPTAKPLIISISRIFLASSSFSLRRCAMRLCPISVAWWTVRRAKYSDESWHMTSFVCSMCPGKKASGPNGTIIGCMTFSGRSFKTPRVSLHSWSR